VSFRGGIRKWGVSVYPRHRSRTADRTHPHEGYSGEVAGIKMKRLGVSSKTLRRFDENAEAFFMKDLGVLFAWYMAFSVYLLRCNK
jgi:hypothetical protein